MVWKCVQKLNRLARSNKVALLWVPGQMGIEGQMEAASIGSVGPEALLFKRRLKRGEEANKSNL